MNVHLVYHLGLIFLLSIWREECGAAEGGKMLTNRIMILVRVYQPHTDMYRPHEVIGKVEWMFEATIRHETLTSSYGQVIINVCKLSTERFYFLVWYSCDCNIKFSFCISKQFYSYKLAERRYANKIFSLFTSNSIEEYFWQLNRENIWEIVENDGMGGEE